MRAGRRREVGAVVALVCAGLGAGAVALLARRWLVHVTVHGNSMAPLLRHGDSTLVLRTPPATVRRGQIVVGLTPDGGEAPEAELYPPHFVKRVVGLAGDRVRRPGGELVTVPPGSYYVRGEADLSLDSDAWGPVDRTQVLGVVLGRLSRGTGSSWSRSEMV